MIGRDNSNQLPILTAASFLLCYFLGPAKALLVAAWEPRMDLRHCFPARDLPAGLRFLLHCFGTICRKAETCIFIFSYVSLAPDPCKEGLTEELVFCSEAIQRSEAPVKGRCLAARAGTLCHWILLIALT